MEPFKNAFNADMIANMARHLSDAGPFDAARFQALATDGLNALELKARSHHIADALQVCLPDDFFKASAQMIAALHPSEDDEGWVGKAAEHGIRGWAMMPMGEVIARRGLDHFDLALDTLAAFTPRFSAEFDVRPFLQADQARAMVHVSRWAQHPNPHLRRLASEGTRPRLPWGMQLKALIADPVPVLPILERLRDDPSDYVRRSVANNLNDIAKDHPDLVAQIAMDWLLGASNDRKKLVRHACRTLIKAGHPGALAAFGYAPPQLSARFTLSPETARMGDDVEMVLTLQSTGKTAQKLVVDYVLHYVRAGGKTGPKVFKWTQTTLAPGATCTLTKAHKLREVTTRRHYAGLHRIQAQVNGQAVAEATFTLSRNG